LSLPPSLQLPPSLAAESNLSKDSAGLSAAERNVSKILPPEPAAATTVVASARFVFLAFSAFVSRSYGRPET
jgi:hypothetical protein